MDQAMGIVKLNKFNIIKKEVKKFGQPNICIVKTGDKNRNEKS